LIHPHHIFRVGRHGAATTSMSEPKATRATVKRSLRPTYHLLGDGLRKLLRHKLLRVTLLAAVFLGARWNPVMRIPLIPTLLLMFSLRHFVLTPPKKKDKEKACGTVD